MGMVACIVLCLLVARITASLDAETKERLDALDQRLVEANSNLKKSNIAFEQKLFETNTDLMKAKLDLQKIKDLLESERKTQVEARGITELESPVSFSALMGSHNENLGLHQTVKFETIITNQGGGYNNYTSVFAAPVTGTYYFSVTLMTFQNQHVEAELVVNGNKLIYIYSGSVSGSGRWNQGSNSVVKHIRQGDAVWVRINNNQNANSDVHIIGNTWSTFSGFCLNYN